MLTVAAQTALAPWTERAVHDTVAAIVGHPSYERLLTDTLWLRFLRWLGEQIRVIRDFLGGSRNAGILVLVLLGIVVLLVIARVVINEMALQDPRIPGVKRREHAAGGDALLEAERLAAAGQYTLAAHALFAAMLNVFSARGEVRLHPSKTTGDYARELRRRNSLYVRGFSAFRSRYDHLIYGTMECSADDYSALLRDARPLFTGERAP